MKLSMQITLDGLLRALRWRAHNATEEYELSRENRARGEPAKARPYAGRRMFDEGDRDDRASR